MLNRTVEIVALSLGNDAWAGWGNSPGYLLVVGGLAELVPGSD